MSGIDARTPEPAGAGALGAYLSISALLSLALWILLLLPNFLAARGWSSQRIGWVVGMYFIVNLLSQLTAGHLADRYGNLRIALCGAALGIVGGIVYLGALRLPSLIFAARVLHAAGAALITAGVLIELIGQVPLHLKGRMIGYFGLPGFVMLGAGPVLSEWFVYRWGFKGTFVSIILIFATMGVLLTRLPSRLAAPRPPTREPFVTGFRHSFPLLRPVLTYSTLVGLCFSAWQSFLAPAVHGLGPGSVSNFGFGYALGAVSTRLGLSHRLDSGPKRLAGIATLVGFGGALAAIPHAWRPWQLIAVGLACGMSHGIYYPSLSSVAAERFHPVHSGQAMALYISASSVGMFVGPPLWGALADAAGYSVVFAAAGGVLAAGTIVFVLFERQSMSRIRPAVGALDA
jgi:MFS family permease